MTQKEYERLTPEQMKARRWRLCRSVTTMAMSIPVGTEVKLLFKRSGFNIEAEKCPHCGIRVYARKVPPGYIEEYNPPPECTCGASKDPAACGHSPSCPMKKVEG